MVSFIFHSYHNKLIDKKNMPSMSLETIVEALTAAIEAIVDTDVDLKVTGGATH